MSDKKIGLLGTLLVCLPFSPSLAIVINLSANKYGFRYVMVWMVAVASLGILSKVLELYDGFCRRAKYDDKERLRLEISKKKLQAEICAAVAILGFLTTMYRTGLDFDQFNTPMRSDYAFEASGKFGELVSHDCSTQKKDERIRLCGDIYGRFSRITAALWARHVEETVVNDETEGIKAALGQFSDTEKSQTLISEIKSLLERLVIAPDEWYKYLSFLIPGFLLIAAMYAISAKVAIAWFEASIEKKPIVLSHRIRVIFLVR